MIYLYWSIYLAGFIISYSRLKRQNNDRVWFRVFLALFLAVFSWLGIIIHILIDYFEANPIKIPKPPKWL
jgi:ATP/ADP translocase